MHSFNSIWRGAKAKRFWGDTRRNLPLTLLTVAVALSIDAYGVLGIFQMTPATVEVFGHVIGLAPFEAALTIGCGLLALAGSAAAADLRHDPRPSIRRTAWRAQALAAFLLLPQINAASEAFAFQGQLAVWREYMSTDAPERARQASALDPQDGIAREELARAARPLDADFDLGCWIWAAFLLGANMLAAGVFRKPRPETEREAERRYRAFKAAKAAETRKANLAAKAKAEAALKSKTPNVVQMLRTGKAS